MLKEDPTADMKTIFAGALRHLRHSPLDPTCPARLAEKRATAAKPTSKDAPPAVPNNKSPAITQPVVILEDEPNPGRAKVGAAPDSEDTNMSTPC